MRYSVEFQLQEINPRQMLTVTEVGFVAPEFQDTSEDRFLPSSIPGQQSMPSTNVHVTMMHVAVHSRVTGDRRHQNRPEYEQDSEQP